METSLNEMTNFGNTLQHHHQGLEDLKGRLQELMEDRHRLKQRLEALTGDSHVDDKSGGLLMLHKALKLVIGRGSGLMSDLFVAKRKERSPIVSDGYIDPSGLIDWIKELGESGGEDWEAVKEIRDQAVKICVRLSRLLIDVMIMMSQSDPAAVEIFRMFSSSLEYVEDDFKSAVLNKFDDLLKVTDTEILNFCAKSILDKDANFFRMIDEKLEKEADGDEQMKTKVLSAVAADKYVSFLNQDLRRMRWAQASHGDPKPREMDKSKLEELLDKCLSVILQLDLIMEDPGVPYLKMYIDETLGVLKTRLKQSEQDFETLKVKLVDLWMFSSISYPDGNLMDVMEMKIDELWMQFKEPKKEHQGGGN